MEGTIPNVHREKILPKLLTGTSVNQPAAFLSTNCNQLFPTCKVLFDHQISNIGHATEKLSQCEKIANSCFFQ